MQTETPPESPRPKRNWIREGLIWAVFMYITMTFLFPLATGDEINWKRILISIPIWLFAGIGYGYTTKRYWERIRKRKESRTHDES